MPSKIFRALNTSDSERVIYSAELWIYERHIFLLHFLATGHITLWRSNVFFFYYFLKKEIKEFTIWYVFTFWPPVEAYLNLMFIPNFSWLANWHLLWKDPILCFHEKNLISNFVFFFQMFSWIFWNTLVVLLVGPKPKILVSGVNTSPFLAADQNSLPDCQIYGRTYCLQIETYPT